MIGVGTLLADMVGFDVYGIEIDSSLVEVAEQLNGHYEQEAVFACGSFVPDGVDDLVDLAFAENDGSLSMVTDAVDAYGELGHGIDDFDITFCFPWSTDEDLTGQIFDCRASTGAILLTYNEANCFPVCRKA